MAGGPGGLKIESTGNTVDVEQFAGKEQARADAALQGLKIDITQHYTAAGYKFILVQTFTRDQKFAAGELLTEGVHLRAREGRPARFPGKTGGQHELFPQPRGEWGEGDIHHQFGTGRLAAGLTYLRNAFRG